MKAVMYYRVSANNQGTKDKKITNLAKHCFDYRQH